VHYTERIVVIGAGIVGAFVARELAIRGIAVTVLDPAPEAGASYGNAGLVTASYCRPTGPEILRNELALLSRRRSPVTLGRPIQRQLAGWVAAHVRASGSAHSLAASRWLHHAAINSIEAYRRIGETELDIGFRQAGWLWVYESPSARHRDCSRIAALRSVGVEVTQVDADVVASLEPALSPSPARAGLIFARDAQVDPGLAASRILADACARGAIHERSTATGFAVVQGKLRAVATDAGLCPASHAVVCAGHATDQLANQLGARPRILPGVGWSLTLPWQDGLVMRPLMLANEHVVVSPLRDSLRLTSGMRLGGFLSSEPPHPEIVRMRQVAQRYLPALRDLPAGRPWVGARPMRPSGLPVIKRLESCHHVFIASGHGTLGITLAPATATRVADLISQERHSSRD
jgi:D-amino-acid dehydrogenase